MKCCFSRRIICDLIVLYVYINVNVLNAMRLYRFIRNDGARDKKRDQFDYTVFGKLKKKKLVEIKNSIVYQ